MTSDIATDLPGDPQAIRDLATFLRRTWAPALDTHSTALTHVSSGAATAWTGASGSAFAERLTATYEASDGLAALAPGIGQALDALAEALAAAQQSIESARTQAAAAGLHLRTGGIVNPAPLLDALDQEQARALVDAWSTAIDRVSAAVQAWLDAVEAFIAQVPRLDADLTGITAELLTGTIETGAIAAASFRLTATRSFHLDNAARLSAHVDALTAGGTARTSPQHLYELLDAADDSRRMAAQADDLLRKGVKVGSRLGRALTVVGFAATGYAIYDDIEQGESVTQAVVSNGGSMLAGLAAGAATGAIVGSFIVPPVGTVVGAALGTIVGAGVGMFTSGVIDHLFEEGADSLGAVASAGWEEITDTGEAIGDLATGAWDAIFG